MNGTPQSWSETDRETLKARVAELECALQHCAITIGAVTKQHPKPWHGPLLNIVLSALNDEIAEAVNAEAEE